ncbi:hypothetical protein BGZ73_000818 [Actinomortierella ambigua]|nr:hypothetical protein BGZ73_000818 [Actinomortierella ambigua]
MYQALLPAEILACVFSFLRNEDLIKCTIVSRSWHAVANACIWKSLSLDDYRTTVPKDSFRKNAYYVTHLEIRSADQVVPYGLCCTNLCDLTLPSNLRPEQHGDSLVELIHMNQGTLHSLKMGMRLVRPPLLLQAIEGAHRLKKLDQLSGTDPSSSTFWQLRELAIAFPQSQKAFDFYVPLLRHCPKLVRIRLPPLPKCLLPDLHDYLRRTDSHPSFTTPANAATLCHGFSSCRPPIESIDLSVLVTYKDADFAGILEACPPNTLKEIDLRQRMVGHEATQAVLRHSQSLVKLNMLNIHGSVTSQWIQTLLESCAKLQCVVIRSMQPDIVYLHADHILEGLNTGKGWACKQLRVLQVPIGGLCLPLEQSADKSSTMCYPSPPSSTSASTITTTTTGTASASTHHSDMDAQRDSTHEHPVSTLCRMDDGDNNILWALCAREHHATTCLAKHNQVFKHLSQLKHLRLLNVTRGLSRGPTVPDWLDWRQGSGFSHLAALKSLEELVLQRDATFRPDELEWMKIQWPRCAFFNRFG